MTVDPRCIPRKAFAPVCPDDEILGAAGVVNTPDPYLAGFKGPGICHTELSLEDIDGPTRWLCVVAGYEGRGDDGIPVERWITLGAYSGSAGIFEPMRFAPYLTASEARRVGEALIDAAAFTAAEPASNGDPFAAVDGTADDYAALGAAPDLAGQGEGI